VAQGDAALRLQPYLGGSTDVKYMIRADCRCRCFLTHRRTSLCSV